MKKNTTTQPQSLFSKHSMCLKKAAFCIWAFLFAQTALAEERIDIQRVNASIWQQGNGNWHSRNVNDGKLSTSWGTGRYFEPNAEWLQLSFDKAFVLETLEIATGVQGDPANFARNGRPKEIQLTFSDGASQKILLADQIGLQKISLQPTKTRWLRLQVTKIYWGDRSSELTSDFGIAEIHCYGSETLHPKPLLPSRGVITLESQTNAMGTTPLQK